MDPRAWSTLDPSHWYLAGVTIFSTLQITPASVVEPTAWAAVLAARSISLG